LLVCEYALRIL